MPADENVQKEVSMEAMADETAKTANVNNSLQTGVDRQAINNITAQLLQGGVSALNQLMHSNVRLLDLAAQKAMEHWDKASIVSNANAGAAADAAIDQSPPDEGERQVKKE